MVHHFKALAVSQGRRALIQGPRTPLMWLTPDRIACRVSAVLLAALIPIKEGTALMKVKMFIAGTVGLAACGVLLGAAMLNQDSAGTDGGSNAEMMKAWMAYSMPGPGQAKLATRAGKWDVAVTHWMAPGTPPQTSQGTSTFEMKYGGRYLFQNYYGDWDGNPFEGFGISAYNNKTGKYQFTWLDSLATGLMQGSGEFNGGTLEWTGMATDPIRGDMPMRGVETFVNADEFTSAMYAPGPDGKEFKMMAFVYTRTSGGGEGHSHDHPFGHDHPKGDHPK